MSDFSLLESGNGLEERVISLYCQDPDPAKDYYFFTLTAPEEGNPEIASFSEWAGESPTPPHRELRRPCFVLPDVMRKNLAKVKQPCFVIDNDADFVVWTIWGGNALISQEMALEHLSSNLESSEIVRPASGGMISPQMTSPEHLKRAPARKLRMQIFDRDGRRCAICGQSPDKNVHVELEAHHIRPFGFGGLTEKTNLITLCSACHDGLDPHYDHSLFQRIGVDPIRCMIEGQLEKYWNGVQNYHKWLWQSSRNKDIRKGRRSKIP